MHYKDKKRSRALLLIVGQALESLRRSFDKVILDEVFSSLQLVLDTLEQEINVPSLTIDSIQDLMTLLRDASSKNGAVPGTVSNLFQDLLNKFDQEVEARVKVAFFPYKASMWDSLESIYLAAAKDPACDVSVVPIPYYTLSENGAESHYCRLSH